ncbi:MAG: glutamate-cysteine ligase family protein [Planctomycetota bacterium]|jgi:hypothetical protein
MTGHLHLFDGFGIELEYMLVDASSLDVRPLADSLLTDVAGELTEEVELGETAWSNELALHVIEFKTNGPARDLAPLPGLFQRDVERANGLLAARGARLMPTGMHPWMDPHRELVLWPHEASPIYEAFHGIFDCRGHGWANLQSVHLNLPFADDEEFGRLHAAIRLVLPLLPALAASSPVADARPTGRLDTRLHHYRANCARVPSVTGHVIPEGVYTRRDYETVLLGGIYEDLAPLDPGGVLRHEWVNARGAIARFDRQAIEIRLLDVQECPRADLAICALVVEVLRALCDGRWLPFEEQSAWPIEPLERVLLDAMDQGDRAGIEDADFLAAFGFPGRRASAAELWGYLAAECLGAGPAGAPWRATIDELLERGPLARRLLTALGEDPSRDRLHAVYTELCDCLSGDRLLA